MVEELGMMRGTERPLGRCCGVGRMLSSMTKLEDASPPPPPFSLGFFVLYALLSSNNRKTEIKS